MLLVQYPYVGPILGHVTEASARVFLSATYPSDDNHLLYGVLEYKKVGSGDWEAPFFLEAKPYFDFSVVMGMTHLEAGCEYEYRCGFLTDDQYKDCLTNQTTLDWSKIPVKQFRTRDLKQKKVRLAFGSCRYTLKFLNQRFFDDRSDRVFKPIKDLHDDKGLDALFLIGDQIYADPFNSLGGASSRLDEFLKQYRDTFSSKNFSNMVAEVPTYTAIDDHEIEDNWPKEQSKQDMLSKYPSAMHSYGIYQASYTPLGELDDDKRRITQLADCLYYSFSIGCCDFFVLDTRTERDLANNKVISDEQMQSFLAWLLDGSGNIKVVASAIPFLDVASFDQADKWGGFVNQRKQVTQALTKHPEVKTLFLTGDIHSSQAAKLTWRKDKRFKSIHVSSSPFYWPYPMFRDSLSSSFNFSKNIFKNKFFNPYKVDFLSKNFKSNSFTFLEIDQNSVEIVMIDNKGKEVYRLHESLQ